MGVGGVEDIFGDVDQARANPVLNDAADGAGARKHTGIWLAARGFRRNIDQAIGFANRMRGHDDVWYRLQQPGHGPASAGSVEPPAMIGAFDGVRDHPPE